MFCNYSEIFGKPNTGAHAIRVFDIAIVDVILTLIVAIILIYYTRSILPLFLLFGGGIIAHRLFCVNTTVDRWLFGENIKK